jgi:hypothetical protein
VVPPSTSGNGGGCSIGGGAGGDAGRVGGGALAWLALLGAGIFAWRRRVGAGLAAAALTGCGQSPERAALDAGVSSEPTKATSAIATTTTTTTTASLATPSTAATEGLALGVREWLARFPRLDVKLDHGASIVRDGARFRIARAWTTVDASIADGGALRLASPFDAGAWIEIAAHHATVSGRSEPRGVLFRDVAAATDALAVPIRGGVEDPRVLRGAAAPTTFTWSLRHGPAIARFELRDLRVVALAADGHVRFAAAPPFAVDAAGTRRALATSLRDDGDHAELRLALDVAGLQYPIAVDPAWTLTKETIYPYQAAGLTAGVVAHLASGGDVVACNGTESESLSLATMTWTKNAGGAAGAPACRRRGSASRATRASLARARSSAPTASAAVSPRAGPAAHAGYRPRRGAARSSTAARARATGSAARARASTATAARAAATVSARPATCRGASASASRSTGRRTASASRASPAPRRATRRPATAPMGAAARRGSGATWCAGRRAARRACGPRSRTATARAGARRRRRRRARRGGATRRGRRARRAARQRPSARRGSCARRAFARRPRRSARLTRSRSSTDRGARRAAARTCAATGRA